MPATFPDHERGGSSVMISQPGGQMDQATQTHPRPIAGDKSKPNAVTTAQTNATDDGTSRTSGTSLGSRQDTRPEPKEVNKRSLEYVLRSGCAGGLAGCSVSEYLSWSIYPRTEVLTMPGKNSCRTSRPGQDSLPSVEPSIRQIYRKLVWFSIGDAGYSSF